jgi:hypothetical protein
MVPCTGESPPTGQGLTEQAAIFSSNLLEGVSPPKMNAPWLLQQGVSGKVSCGIMGGESQPEEAKR